MDKKFNILMNPKLLERIKKEADRLSMKVSTYIRVAVIEKLNKSEDKK